MERLFDEGIPLSGRREPRMTWVRISDVVGGRNTGRRAAAGDVRRATQGPILDRPPAPPTSNTRGPPRDRSCRARVASVRLVMDMLRSVTALKIAERCGSRAAPQQDVACWFTDRKFDSAGGGGASPGVGGFCLPFF